jgi:hypothetical protein
MPRSKKQGGREPRPVPRLPKPRKVTQFFDNRKPNKKESVMMFTADSKKLAKQIESAFASTNSKSGNEVARVICFHYDGRKLNLSSTDFNTATLNSEEVIGDGEEFTAFIDAKVASSIAKAIKKENTSVSVTPGKTFHAGVEYKTLAFCHGNRIISPRSEEVKFEHYPTFPPPEGTAFEMSAGSLLSMLKKAEIGTRHRKGAWDVYYRTLGFRYNENNCLEIIGTNQKTLSRVRSDVKIGENFKKAMKHEAIENFVPVSIDLMGLLKKAFRPEENIKFSFMTGFADFGWASIEGKRTRALVSINGSVTQEAIDFLFEHKPKHLIEIDTASFATALKNTQKYTDGYENAAAKLTIQDQSLAISIKSEFGSCHETLPIEWAKGEAQETMTFTIEPKNLVVALDSKQAPRKVMFAPPTNETDNTVWLLMERDWVLITMPAKSQCFACGRLETNGIAEMSKCCLCGQYTCRVCCGSEHSRDLVCKECNAKHET